MQVLSKNSRSLHGIASDNSTSCSIDNKERMCIITALADMFDICAVTILVISV